MVDHHVTNASQGAIGVIDAGGKAEEGIEHYNVPATGTPTEPDAVQGKLAFETKSLACHSIGGGAKLGPDLLGVTKRRTDDWPAKWLKSPENMIANDPDAEALRAQFPVAMPNQNPTDKEITHYLHYFRWADENVQTHNVPKP